jgi:hypothetical protein
VPKPTDFTPRFNRGDKVEGQKYGQGAWIQGIVVRVPSSLRGMYWVTQQENPDLTLTRVKVGGLGEIKQYAPMTEFYQHEMRPIVTATDMKEAKDDISAAWDKVKAVGGDDLLKVKAIDAAIALRGIQVLNEDEVLQNIEAAGSNPNPDPYAYFEQFKSELQTMGNEISAMLIEFGLDMYQIKDVLRYAEKDAKHTLGKSEAVAA